MNSLKEYVGDKNFYKKILSIAIPISAQQLITVGVNLMDTIMLSSMGDTQLSASALGGQFINLYQIFCMGIGMGASVLTSRYWGMKELPSLRKAVTIMLRFVLILSSLFTLATIFAPNLIIRMYTPEKDIIKYGVIYLRWQIPVFVCIGLSLTCTIVLRSVGQVRIPLISSIIAFFVNIFFNWVFIFGHLGAPRMEIAGAAVGTLIARLFELTFICGYFFFYDKRISYKIKDISMRCADLLFEYIRVCIPVFISDGLLALGNNAVAMVIGRIGKTFVSANSVTTILQQLSSVLTQGMAHASCIVTGHTMGEGDMEKAQKQGYTFLGIGFILGCFAAVVILLMRTPIINYYKVSEETKAIAWELMDAIGFIVIFQSMNSVLTKGVLRAGGDTRFLMAGDILFLWVASIPLGIIAGLVLHMPPFWIYTFLKIDQIIKCVWCYFRLRSRKWMKKIRTAS